MIQAAQHNGIERRGFLDGPWLILFCLATVFFPRVLAAAGAPAIINFAHFAVVLFTFIYSFTQERTEAARKLTWGITLLFILIILSALFNRAGVINTFLEYILLAEHFMLLVAICNARWTSDQVNILYYGILFLVIIHSLFGHFQFFVQGARADDVKGLFLGQGAGHHVAGAICLSASVFLMVDRPYDSKILAVALSLFSFLIVFFSDSKQVLAVFLAALFLLIVYKQLTAKPQESSPLRTYIIVAVLAVGTLLYVAVTVFPALQTWADVVLIRQGLIQKFTVFPITISHYTGEWNWLVGLGPGHTVGRLGLMIPDYVDLLETVDLTVHPATHAIVQANYNHWMSNSVTGSSMWALTFSFAGIWGDLGVLGVVVYLLSWGFVWKYVCFDDVSRYLVATVIVFGAAYAWLEEPAYMLFVVSLIGLRYQRHQVFMQQSAGFDENMSRT